MPWDHCQCASTLSGLSAWPACETRCLWVSVSGSGPSGPAVCLCFCDASLRTPPAQSWPSPWSPFQARHKPLSGSHPLNPFAPSLPPTTVPPSPPHVASAGGLRGVFGSPRLSTGWGGTQRRNWGDFPLTRSSNSLETVWGPGLSSGQSSSSRQRSLLETPPHQLACLSPLTLPPSFCSSFLSLF